MSVFAGRFLMSIMLLFVHQVFAEQGGLTGTFLELGMKRTATPAAVGAGDPSHGNTKIYSFAKSKVGPTPMSKDPVSI